MNRAMRFRIEPNKAQRELLEKTFGCCDKHTDGDYEAYCLMIA